MNMPNIEEPDRRNGTPELKVGLEPNLGLFGGVMLGVGCIIGSGIFVSTKGVHENAGSVGASLIIWILCGVFSTFGAYCYAELGTLITKSGGDYAYVNAAFGKFLAFVRLWIECIIIRPCSLAAVAIVFAQYALQPFFPCNGSPGTAVQALAACCLADSEAFVNIFGGPPVSVGKIAIAFYSGSWSFSGWNYICNITEELKNPTRNLPLAIGLSCLICTIIYTLVNVAFYAGVSLTELVESEAVAVTFAQNHFGFFSPIMPLFVAMSCFGSINGVLLTTSRLFYAGARENQMPTILSMINPYTGTPMPSVFFIMFLSMGYLTLSDNIYSLINSIQIVIWIAVAMTVAGLMYLRIKMPIKDNPRPVKVNLIFPIVFLTCSVFLISVPIYQEFEDSMIGLALIVTSLPIYYFFIHRIRPKSIDSAIDKMTLMCQKLMLVVEEEKNFAYQHSHQEACLDYSQL